MKDCMDCYFGAVWGGGEPCCGCKGFDMLIDKNHPEGYCETCMHSESDIEKHPCAICGHIHDIGYDNWRAK